MPATASGTTGSSSDLAAFVDALGLETFHLLGFSMGAMTALQFAAVLPERLRTLVVVGITPAARAASIGRRGGSWTRAGSTSTTRIGPSCSLGATTSGQGVGAWRRLLPAIAADVAVQPLLTPARSRTRSTRPTMIVCGDRDPFVPIDHAWEAPAAAARCAAVRRAGLPVTRSWSSGRRSSTRRCRASTVRPSQSRPPARNAAGMPSRATRRSKRHRRARSHALIPTRHAGGIR